MFRNQFTELMTADLYAWTMEAYEQLTPVYPQIFKVEQSDAAYEKDTTGIGMGKVTEREPGEDIIFSNPLEGFTIRGKNRTFSDGFQLVAEFVKDTPANKIANVMQAFSAPWAEKVVQAKEQFAADFFNYGGFTAGRKQIFNNTVAGETDPSGDLCYDGLPFFNLSNNTRASKGGGTYYNGTASALSVTNLQTQYDLMTVTNNRDERDDKMMISVDTLVIPPGLHWTAREILESEKQVGSANNTINTVQNLVQSVEWQYLTDTNAWFLGVKQKGLVWQERQTPEIDFYRDDANKMYKATIDVRWGARMKNWRYWSGSNFSTS